MNASSKRSPRIWVSLLVSVLFVGAIFGSVASAGQLGADVSLGVGSVLLGTWLLFRTPRSFFSASKKENRTRVRWFGLSQVFLGLGRLIPIGFPVHDLVRWGFLTLALFAFVAGWLGRPRRLFEFSED